MMEQLYRLHVKDARELRKVVPFNEVDVTITSPPYYKMKDYKFNEQIGQEKTYEEYLQTLTKIFTDLYDLTRESGSLWLVLDTVKKDGELRLLPFDLASRIKEQSNWKLQDVIIWNKKKTLPWSRRGQLRNIFEYILFFSKTKKFKYHIERIQEPVKLKHWWISHPERYNPKGKVPTDIWDFLIPTQGNLGKKYLRHFCPFPTKLVERILLLTTDEGDTVLDPFAGSGIVLALAECMGRRYIGFELKKDYIAMFPKLREEVRKEWKNAQQELHKHKSKQQDLENKIKKLRQLKYPKVLIRKVFGKKLSNHFPIATFAISRNPHDEKDNNKFKFMKEDIYLVFEHAIDKKAIELAINSASSSRPLSKFGIIANPHILTLEEFSKTQTMNPYFDCAKLWLYLNGRVHKFNKVVNFDNWKKHCFEWRASSKFMTPILSNIEVHEKRLPSKRILLKPTCRR